MSAKIISEGSRDACAAMIDYQPFFDLSPNAYVVLDRELRMEAVNEAYLQVTGRTREDLLGRNMFDAFPSDETSENHRQLKNSLLRVLSTGQADELAHIRYDITDETGTLETQYWSATHTPVLNGEGEVAQIIQHTVNITHLQNSLGRDEAGVVERAEKAERRARDLAAEAERMRSLLEQSPGFMAVLSGTEHRFLLANPAYHRLLGHRDFMGKTVAEAVPEVVEQGFVDRLDEEFSRGEIYFGKREKVVFVDSEATEPRETYLEFIFQPIRAEDGNVWGIFIQGHDVTDEVEAGERQRLLIDELNHRVKNTLAIVQGLAQQTFGKERDGRFEVFSARLATLAGTHNLLTESTWQSAGLRDIIYSALEATAGLDIARCRLDGPTLTLPPALALSLAMVMHELSTNAIKFGALSNRSGTVQVAWRVAHGEGAARLIIDWAEAGGPTVSQPAREGFGARLIRRGLASNGTTNLEFSPDGLRCHIEARL